MVSTSTGSSSTTRIVRAMLYLVRVYTGYTPSMRKLPSTKAPANVVLRLLLSRMLENVNRRAEFDEPAGEEEAGILRDASRLLHIVRYDNDSILFCQRRNQFLNLERGDGVERGTRFVHEQHLRAHCQRARDAEPLLLPAGEAQRGGVKPVFYLVP